MRSAEQIKRSPREWKDRQQAEREQALRDFTAATTRAREQHAPWYRWIVDRQAGTHRHELRDEHSRRVACPVPGCRELDGVADPHTASPSSSRSSRTE